MFLYFYITEYKNAGLSSFSQVYHVEITALVESHERTAECESLHKTLVMSDT